MTRRLLAAICFGLLLACEPDPCTDYVDYMCDCHADEIDCEDLETTYENADAELQDECAIALEDQEDEDALNGVECESDSGVTNQ